MSGRCIRHFAIALGLLATLACQADENQAGGNPGEPSSQAQPQIAATIQDRTITLSELDDYIKNLLFKRTTKGDERAIYELRSQHLRTLIDQAVVDQAAAAAGLSNPAFLQQEIDALGPQSSEETAPFYAEAGRSKMTEANMAGLADRIELVVNLTRKAEVVQDLRKQAGVAVHMIPPRSPVDASGPSRGPDDAAITLVSFSNFHCSHCQRSEPIIKKILAQYPDQLRLVYRHYTRRAEPRSQPAAEAAVCAGAQEKFWPYHDRLLENRVGGLSDEDLDGYAVELGLEMESFRQCLSERESKQLVDADTAYAKSHDLVQIPSYFLNGIRITGPQDPAIFSEMIDTELDRLALETQKTSGS
jgi:protein-disulfide isomerase